MYSYREVQGVNKLVKEKGYTKAVDMWSLGCVTVALLTGVSPFAKSSDDTLHTCEDIYRAAADCNLANVDKLPQWQQLNQRAKDFVDGLLTLDESARMTALQALNHPWYSNQIHKQLYDDVYSKATKDWKPRARQADVIETIQKPLVYTVGPLSDHKALQSNMRKPYKPRIRQPKVLKPIEAHYQPYHKSIDQLLSPTRNQKQLRSIAEVVEEWDNLVSGKLKDLSNTMNSESPNTPEFMTDDSVMTLASVETLRLTEVHTIGNGRAVEQRKVSLLPLMTPEPRSRVDLMATSLPWLFESGKVSKHTDRVPSTFPETSASSLSPEVPNENRTKNLPESQDDRIVIQEVQNTQTTPRGFLKRPKRSILRLVSPNRSPYGARSPKKRKRLHVFEIDDEDEEETMESHLSDDGCDTAFTPINRRESVQLGDLEGSRSESGSVREYSKYKAPHDGPLLIKKDTNSPRRKDTKKNKYFDEDISAKTSPVEIPNSVSCPEEEEESPGSPTKRRISVFDYEEAALYLEASKENRLFTTARSFSQAVKKKRAEKLSQLQKEQEVLPSGDHGDSIRTAY